MRLWAMGAIGIAVAATFMIFGISVVFWHGWLL